MENGAGIICSRFTFQGEQNKWKTLLEQELWNNYFSYQTQELLKHLMLLQ